MYHSRSSSSNSNRNYRGHGRGGSRRSGFSRRKQSSFDPSRLVKNAETRPPAPAYIAKNEFSSFAIVDQLKQTIADRGYKIQPRSKIKLFLTFLRVEMLLA